MRSRRIPGHTATDRGRAASCVVIWPFFFPSTLPIPTQLYRTSTATAAAALEKQNSDRVPRILPLTTHIRWFFPAVQSLAKHGPFLLLYRRGNSRPGRAAPNGLCWSCHSVVSPAHTA